MAPPSTRVKNWVERLADGKITIPTLLALGTFSLFLVNLDRPESEVFDEVRYIPAARQILFHGVNENWSHPGFAKFLIATGMALFGDHPLGWRIMSVVFGVLTVLGVYWLGLALFKNRLAALQSALICVLNQIVFVQSRVATLDIFATGLFMPAVALFAQNWMAPERIRSSRGKLELIGAGVLFGLASGAKWVSLIPMAACFALYTRVERANPGRIILGSGTVMGVAILAYLASLSPLVGMYHPSYGPSVFSRNNFSGPYGWFDLIQLQTQIFKAQISYFNPHPYFAPWYTWPLDLRPIWYHRDLWPDGLHQSGVLLVGNPLILWSGLLAAAYSLWAHLRHQRREALFLAAMYFPLLMFWGVLPRMASLFYYYLPASVFLGPMLVLAARELKTPPAMQGIFLTLTGGVFFYFYPILTNTVLSLDQLQARIWLSSWW